MSDTPREEINATIREAILDVLDRIVGAHGDLRSVCLAAAPDDHAWARYVLEDVLNTVVSAYEDRGDT